MLRTAPHTQGPTESEDAEGWAENPRSGDVLFVDIFAGSGALSRAVKASSVPTARPNEFSQGGTNFSKKREVESLRAQLQTWSDSGVKLAIHLAPPCHTFSRARDRSGRTRLRSPWYPDGLPAKQQQVKVPNLIAKRAFLLASWAARKLDAFVTLENHRRVISG